MLSNTKKRIILAFFDVLFSLFIWQINVSLGNPCYSTAFSECFILSTTTFLIIYTPFEIYWSFRDLWFDRWINLSSKEIEVSEVKIDLKDGTLTANIIKNRNSAKVKLKNSIIVICHGFSDTKESLQYYCFPLAYQGYVVLTYDARGTGKSKRLGKRSDFLNRIEDFKKVIEWINLEKEFSKFKIFSIGFSIGAITTLCGGFLNHKIKKIIAISSMSYYKQNIPKYNPVVMLSYFLKHVKLFPNKEENEKLSPYLVIKNAKKDLTEEEWKKLSRRVMLVHCKNDKIIKFKNFEENRILLETPEKNLIILRKGGHSHKKNESSLVGATLSFFNS
ncbi:MAG: alpha/beta hydrolase [Promethearchaeota archaeon]